MVSRKSLAVLAVLLALARLVMAQQPSEAAATDASPEEKQFKALTWRQIGPFRGGRVLAVAGVPSQPHTYYFGAVAGGVWKTTDGGTSWKPMFDKQRGVSSIGSIAVAESDPNVIYVGTGEACIRGNIVAGNGMYKSTDAGKTWQRSGLAETQTIGRVIVHPRNADVVFVAAMGHVYATNPDRGVFRSTDGGKTWQKVLYKDDKTGGIDIAFDPSNPNILFAALWEAHRTPWEMVSGGPGSGLYKSSDGGTTWKQLQGNGLPKTVLGRIGVSVSGANPNRVYALVEAAEGGLFRSDDGGENWRLMNDERRIRQRAWYYTHVFADPKSADTVYVLNTSMYRSNDAGKTFAVIPAPHGDHHGLWIDPTNPNRMINSNDGGANVSVNGGATWTGQDNQPTAQFYHVIADNRYPYYVYGAQQDNSTVAIATRSDNGTIDRSDWYDVGGGESGYIAPDPRDPNIVYAGSYGGYLTRLDRRSGQLQAVNPWPQNPMGHGAADLQYRFQWTYPIVISKHDPDTVYAAAQVLFKSIDKGMSWSVISSDLTRNDRSKQGPSGGPITKDNTSVEYYDTIFALAESPLQRDVIWAGTDDGLIQVTRDGGKNWTNVTPKAMPEWGTVNLIEASPFDGGTAYVALDRHELDDWAPYVYKTGDYGKSWSRVNKGIPNGAVLRAVREDPSRRGLLYAGTESGIYVSFDDGANWQNWLQRNLPTTPIADLIVKGNDIVVATHGRSFWALDNIGPVREYNAQIASEDAHLFKPGLTYRQRGGGGGGGEGPSGNVGANPPTGAVVYYSLKTAPKAKEEITLEVIDAQGKLVRKFSNIEKQEPGETAPAEQPAEGRTRPNQLPAEAGLNRFVWNLRFDDATRVPSSPIWGGGTAGPLVLPGTYQLKLTVGGKTVIQPLEVTLDPRVNTPIADLQKQFALLWQMHEKLTATHDAVNQIRSIRKQMQDLEKRVASSANAKAISEAVKKLDEKMTPIEEELIQVKSKSSQDPLNYPIQLNNKLAALANIVESADTAPTQQSYEVYKTLAEQIDAQLARWRQVFTTDVPAFNEFVRQQNVPAVAVAEPSKEAGK